MARSRMIKPEFFNDEKLAILSRDSRMLFVGMWVMGDDYGVVKGHNRWLQSQVFPYEAIPHETFDGWLKELEQAGLVVRFEHSGEQFIYICNFTKHQKVDRPSKSRNPSPPDELLAGDVSPKTPPPSHTRETLDEHSRVSPDEIEREVEIEREEERESEPLATLAPVNDSKVKISETDRLIGKLVTDGIEARAEINFQKQKKENGNRPENISQVEQAIVALQPDWSMELIRLRAEQWYTSYTSRFDTGPWMIKNKPIKDWQQALRNKITYWKQDDLKTQTENGNRKSSKAAGTGLAANLKGKDYTDQPGKTY